MLIKRLAQEAVVGVRREHLLRRVHVEAERQENFHVRPFLQYSLVDLAGVFQLADADRVWSHLVTLCVQWV